MALREFIKLVPEKRVLPGFREQLDQVLSRGTLKVPLVSVVPTATATTTTQDVATVGVFSPGSRTSE